MRSTLIDTGSIVGLFNSADKYHAHAERFFASLSGTDRLFTTWAVVTECSYALRRNREAFYDWLLSGAMVVADFGLDDLAMMRAWSGRYRDREVDFADASLAWLATIQKLILSPQRISTISRLTGCQIERSLKI